MLKNIKNVFYYVKSCWFMYCFWKKKCTHCGMLQSMDSIFINDKGDGYQAYYCCNCSGTLDVIFYNNSSRWFQHHNMASKYPKTHKFIHSYITNKYHQNNF